MPYLNNSFTTSSTTSSAYTAADRFYWSDDYVNKYTNPSSTVPLNGVILITPSTSASTSDITLGLYSPAYPSTGYNISISVYFEVVNSSNPSLGVSTTYTGFDNVQKTF